MRKVERIKDKKQLLYKSIYKYINNKKYEKNKININNISYYK